jgi:ATP-dependent Clp protease ATP-binding subunit ClpC
MTTDATDPDGAVLGPGAAAIVRRANDAAADSGDAALGVNHWLIAVVTRNAAMAEGLADGLAASALRPWLHERLRAGEAGARLDEATVVADARTLAARRGSATPNEADVVEVVLRAAGYTVHGKSGPVAGGPPTPPGGGPGMASGAAHGAASGATDGAAVAGGGGQESPSTPQGDSARPASDGGAGPATAPGGGAWTPRAKRPTPTLDAFGRDLTAEARAGRLPELIGREVELSVVVETLCRRTKRNPALVGPAGTGKTAIVEGLAARVVAGEVPALLRGFRIVQLSPSSLVAGAGVYGVLDERMKAVLAEAAQDGIALFIDELHSIVGAGGARGSSDLASLLKPALARGDIACIAATTDEEYRRFIEDDPALERRFAPVLVREPTVEQTIAIVSSHRDALVALRGVAVDDPLLGRIVRFAGDAMPDRRYPDKAVELLEQVVAHAVATGRPAATPEDVDVVGRRLTGLPTDVGRRLDDLAGRLAAADLLSPADVDAVIERIGVGMRGADVRRERPNAVVLLAGEVARAAPALAAAIADGLFGSPDRVVTIEAGRMTQDHDVAMLVGAPPGYVGYSDDLPIHAIDRMRACVVLVEDVDRAHPVVLDVLGRAVGSGILADGAGRPIHLSETIVLLATASAAAARRRLGFDPSASAADDAAGGTRGGAAAGRAAIDPRALLGPLLGDEVDVTASEAPGAGSREAWIARTLLPAVARRFAERGVTLTWDPAVVGHLAAQGPPGTQGRAWERYLDDELGPLVAEAIAAPTDASATDVHASVRDGALVLEAPPPSEVPDAVDGAPVEGRGAGQGTERRM